MTGLIGGEEQRILLELAVALAIGLLFGLESGWHGEKEAESKKPAGVRTFGLIGLLGDVGGVIAQALSPVAPWQAGCSNGAGAAIASQLVQSPRSRCKSYGTSVAKPVVQSRFGRTGNAAARQRARTGWAL